MKKWIKQNIRLAFYSTWLLVSFVQLLFTQVQDDEAYYWVYAKFLDWGYFDHPPMTALIIKIGGLLFSGVVGLRIVPLILTTLTIFFTEKIIEPANQKLFYAICLSVAVLQITGFWAVPDVPLIFFTALFFL
ncbi:MAG: 4-amino-4-deoxy-L-arabinose transferase, partial [Chitinophagaceae bacterium]